MNGALKYKYGICVDFKAYFNSFLLSRSRLLYKVAAEFRVDINEDLEEREGCDPTKYEFLGLLDEPARLWSSCKSAVAKWRECILGRLYPVEHRSTSSSQV